MSGRPFWYWRLKYTLSKLVKLLIGEKEPLTTNPAFIAMDTEVRLGPLTL